MEKLKAASSSALARGYLLQDTGPDVQEAIDKIQALVLEGGDDATLLTAEERRKLELLTGILYHDTEYWNEHHDFLPKEGEVVVYSDYQKITDEETGQIKYVPGIKIGTGNGYVADLPFVGEAEAQELLYHMADEVAHITAEERARWNNKINIDDNIEDETLVFTRN